MADDERRERGGDRRGGPRGGSRGGARGGGRRGGPSGGSRGSFRGSSGAGRGRFGKRREGDVDPRPRRDDDRRPRRDDFRGERRERGPRRDDDRRPRRFRDEDEAPKNAAQQRRAEVFAKKGPRRYGKDKPFAPRQDRDERMVDEGSVRGRRFDKSSARRDGDVASGRRDRDGGGKPKRRDPNRSPFPTPPALEDALAREVKKAVGERRFGYVSKQLSRAIVAYDAERYKEALNVLRPVLEDLWLISEVRVLAGRLEYRSQHWKAAAEHLEFSRGSDRSDMTNLPVLIDCYRALKRYELVDELWNEMKEHSPHPSVMAEGRVSAAMSYADRGDVQAAIRIMTHGSEPRQVLPHHLLEWYVLGDLYDRAGDQVTAKKFFVRVANHDSSYYDVEARLAGLGE